MSNLLRQADSAVLNFVQDWICDPLQFSGITLEWQVRASCLISLIGWIWASYFDLMLRKWFDVALDGMTVPIVLGYVMYGIPAQMRIWHRMEGCAWRIFYLIFLGSTAAGVAVGLGSKGWARDWSFFLIALGIFLRVYLLNCKPKPPVGNTKVVFDAA